MKQKTAMQILIDELNPILDNNQFDFSYKAGISSAISKAQQLIEKEKEQIIDARNDALKDKYKSVMNDLLAYGQATIDVKTSEQYYNETYKQD